MTISAGGGMGEGVAHWDLQGRKKAGKVVKREHDIQRSKTGVKRGIGL